LIELVLEVLFFLMKFEDGELSVNTCYLKVVKEVGNSYLTFRDGFVFMF